MSRAGWLGGTFDPIHVGHLDVARAAARALALDSVTLVPASVPPHRTAPHASAAHRFAMTAMAALDVPALRVSDLEMQNRDPSYTTTTLDRLAATGVDVASLFLATGADAFADIASWKGFPAILDRCHFVVVSRPSRAASSLRATLAPWAARMIDAPAGGGCEAPSRPSIFLVDAPTADVSSTEVRRRVGAGESIDGLVPAAVARHISRHGLYART